MDPSICMSFLQFQYSIVPSIPITQLSQSLLISRGMRKPQKYSSLRRQVLQTGFQQLLEMIVMRIFDSLFDKTQLLIRTLCTDAWVVPINGIELKYIRDTLQNIRLHHSCLQVELFQICFCIQDSILTNICTDGKSASLCQYDLNEGDSSSYSDLQKALYVTYVLDERICLPFRRNKDGW